MPVKAEVKGDPQVGAKAKRGDGATAPLSKERVLQQALAIADQEGLEALTMRRLGRDLGAGAMSLYHYVRDKEELLDGMVDIVFAEIYLPESGSDWRKEMGARAISARSILARHRWATPLMESRTSPGPANLRHREAVIACLRKAGFSIRMTAHANWLLDSYIYGYALQEANVPFVNDEDFAEKAQDTFLPQLPPEKYPYLSEVARELLQDGYDTADEFSYGLEMILDALERDRLAKAEG